MAESPCWSCAYRNLVVAMSILYDINLLIPQISVIMALSVQIALEITPLTIVRGVCWQDNY